MNEHHSDTFSGDPSFDASLTGKITQFSTGAIRDNQDGKPDFVETSSPWADWRYAKYMTGKKQKYGAGNFKTMEERLPQITVGLIVILVAVAILRIPYCLYHAFTPLQEAPLICIV